MKIGMYEVTGLATTKGFSQGEHRVKSTLTLKEVREKQSRQDELDDEFSLDGGGRVWYVPMSAQGLSQFSIGEKYELELLKVKEQPIGISGT